MKRIFACALALLLLLAAAGCSGKGDKPAAVDVKDPVELLSKVWASYGEDEKFFIIGGDFDHLSETGPDVYAVSDASALDATFGLPESAAAKVDSAASFMHMMNANTFTAVAFHVASSGDVKAVADALKEGVMAREWMCGFPDKLVLIQLGDYVISAFGNEELIDNFKAKTLAAFSAATLVCDESIF